jgi:hypothetical protein
MFVTFYNGFRKSAVGFRFRIVVPCAKREQAASGAQNKEQQKRMSIVKQSFVTF